MYQGKFSAPRNNFSGDDTPKKRDSQSTAPRRTASQSSTPRRNSSQSSAPRRNSSQSSAPRRNPSQSSTPKRAPSAGNTPKSTAPKTNGTKIFYICYYVMIAVLVIAIIVGMFVLRDFLVKFQAGQVETKYQQIYDEYLTDINWGKIYDKLDETKLGGMDRDSFISVMNETVGKPNLTPTVTSGGMGKKVYKMMNGEAHILSIILENKAPGAIFEEWELFSITMGADTKFKSHSVTVVVPQGSKVSVNGIALTDETHLIRSSVTLAHEMGYDCPPSNTYYLDELWVEPAITVTDASGNSLTAVYDEEADLYSAMPQQGEMADDQKSALTNAAKHYCQHMIGAASSLSSYFDYNSAIYRTLLSNELWIRGWSGYNYSDWEIGNFYQYSDSLFSATLKVKFNVTRGDGSVKTWTVDSTFVLKKLNGTWKVIEMVNQNILDEKVQVRITFSHEGKLLQSQMVDANAKTVSLPASLNAPTGQRFVGWCRNETQADGTVKSVLIFPAAGNGIAQIPTGHILEPMDLIAGFEAIETEGSDA